MRLKLDWNYPLVIAVVAILMIIWVLVAHPAGAYPPIPVIAEQLNIAAGRQLPKGVVWNGRPYFFYIISARQLEAGKYSVVIQAR